MTAMQAVSDNRAIAKNLHLQADRPLPDMLMDYAPRWLPIETADLFLNSLIAFSVGMFAISWWWRIKAYGAVEAHFRSFRIARRFMWMLTIAYGLRAITVLSTTMPPSDTRCSIRQRNWSEIPFMVVEIMLKQGNSCTDKVFSGHSSLATLIGLTWIGALWRPARTPRQARRQSDISADQEGSTDSLPQTAIPISNVPGEALKSVDAFASFKPASVPFWRKLAALGIGLWVVAVYVTCVLCKNHYSIDIVVAVLVCSGIFGVFQLSSKMIALLGRTGALPLFTARKSGHTYTAAAQEDPESLKPAAASGEIVQVATTAADSVLSPIAMREIGVIEAGGDYKDGNGGRLVAVSGKNDLSSGRIPRVTGPFERYLRVVAWMDGFDLQHKSGIIVD